MLDARRNWRGGCRLGSEFMGLTPQVVNKVRNGQKMELTRAFFPSSHRCARAALIAPRFPHFSWLSCGTQWVAAAAITHFMSSRSVAYFISKRGLLNLRLIILVTLFSRTPNMCDWGNVAGGVATQHIFWHTSSFVCSIYFSAIYYNYNARKIIHYVICCLRDNNYDYDDSYLFH